MINFAKRQVVANRHLRALGHSSSILFYFQVEEGCGEHLVLTFNALLSGLYCKSFNLLLNTIFYLACILQSNCSLRSLFLFCADESYNFFQNFMLCSH